jgi:hypothetical protein
MQSIPHQVLECAAETPQFGNDDTERSRTAHAKSESKPVDQADFEFVKISREEYQDVYNRWIHRTSVPRCSWARPRSAVAFTSRDPWIES